MKGLVGAILLLGIGSTLAAVGINLFVAAIISMVIVAMMF